MIGEIYKILVKEKNKYNVIPLFVTIIGGIIGVIMCLIGPNSNDIKSIIISCLIGLTGGTSTTGINQIFKQIKKKGENNG